MAFLVHNGMCGQDVQDVAEKFRKILKKQDDEGHTIESLDEARRAIERLRREYHHD